MLINDIVMQIKGTSVLVGRVRERKKENDWVYVKVDWVETPGVISLRNNLERMLEIRRHQYDASVEWIRCDKLTTIDPEELIASLQAV